MSKNIGISSQKCIKRSLTKMKRYLGATKLKKISLPVYDTKKELSILELSCYAEKVKTNKRKALLNSSLIKPTER